MPEADTKQINPQVVELDIGIHDLRTIEIYPLSVGDQIKLTNMVSEAVGMWVAENPDEQLTAESVSSIIALAQHKIHDVLKIVLNIQNKKEIDKILDMMTNNQLAEIIRIVYETNYQGPIKNVTSLFKKTGQPEEEITLETS